MHACIYKGIIIGPVSDKALLLKQYSFYSDVYIIIIATKVQSTCPCAVQIISSLKIMIRNHKQKDNQLLYSRIPFLYGRHVNCKMVTHAVSNNYNIRIAGVIYQYLEECHIIISLQ